MQFDFNKEDIDNAVLFSDSRAYDFWKAVCEIRHPKHTPISYQFFTECIVDRGVPALLQFLYKNHHYTVRDHDGPIPLIRPTEILGLRGNLGAIFGNSISSFLAMMVGIVPSNEAKTAGITYDFLVEDMFVPRELVKLLEDLDQEISDIDGNNGWLVETTLQAIKEAHHRIYIRDGIEVTPVRSLVVGSGTPAHNSRSSIDQFVRHLSSIALFFKVTFAFKEEWDDDKKIYRYIFRYSVDDNTCKHLAFTAIAKKNKESDQYEMIFRNHLNGERLYRCVFDNLGEVQAALYFLSCEIQQDVEHFQQVEFPDFDEKFTTLVLDAQHASKRN